MTDEMMRQLASTGVVGVLLVLALFALREKDRQLNAEKTARIEDAGKFNALAMSLQREVIAAVNKLSDMLEIWERRESERTKRGGE
jgi:hypothetical protein